MDKELKEFTKETVKKTVQIMNAIRKTCLENDYEVGDVYLAINVMNQIMADKLNLSEEEYNAVQYVSSDILTMIDRKKEKMS